MKQFLLGVISNHKCSDYLTIALNMAAEDNYNPLELSKKLEVHNLSISDLKKESLSLMLDFAHYCLEDNLLTEEELDQAKRLKLFLKIREGDFYENCKDQIAELIHEQLSLMFKDNIIESHESLGKVSLQELFDLGYDQYLELERPNVKEAIERGADISNLDTFFAYSDKS